MEESSTTNYQPQVKSSESEFIVKEEILDLFNDGVEDSMKCGEVFLLQTDRMILLCGFCEKSYVDMNEFGVHIQDNHLLSKKPIIENSGIVEEMAIKVESWDEESQHHENTSQDEDESKLDYIANVIKETKRRKRKRGGPIKTRAQRMEIKDLSLYCSICNTQYETKARFRTHREKKHNILRPCEFCEKPFDSVEERSVHEKTHVGDAPYPCPQCLRMFKQKVHRDHHVQSIHEGIKPHKCSVCDRSFATGTLLRAHRVVHSLPGQHSCEICDRQFAHESRKRLHMRTHTGERSYQCEECGNRYMKQSMLTYHKKQHTGVKDVECKTCGKMFYTKRDLSHHAIIHSSVKRYSCPTCGDSFKQGNALKQHMKLHSNVKEYSCDICGKDFAQFAGLYSHKKSHLKDAAE